ncbi:MAG: hypothetical protein ABRQ26_06995 [Syntrophomonadaceae bacterium]
MLCQEDEGPSLMNEPNTSHSNQRNIFKTLFIICTALLVLVPLFYYLVIPISVIQIYGHERIHNIIEERDKKTILTEVKPDYFISGTDRLQTINMYVGQKILIVVPSTASVYGHWDYKTPENLIEEKLQIDYFGRAYLHAMELGPTPGFQHDEYYAFRAEKPGLVKLEMKQAPFNNILSIDFNIMNH